MQKVVPAKEHEDAMEEVIMTDAASRDNRIVPKIEDGVNDQSASCAPATDRGMHSSDKSRSNLVDRAVDAKAMNTIEIDSDTIAQGDDLPDSAPPNC